MIETGCSLMFIILNTTGKGLTDDLCLVKMQLHGGICMYGTPVIHMRLPAVFTDKIWHLFMS